jgi:stearoyl-CoA desaturase (delta-9 desaturase)
VLEQSLVIAFMIIPVVALVAAVMLTWGWGITLLDVVIATIAYFGTGLGVTVGFHRHFTHKSFKATRPMKVALAITGSLAFQGSIVSWVADHRRHHAFSDKEGDPHSPHVDHGVGFKGALKGLLHAHVGWLFIHTQRGLKTRYAPDLLADKVVKKINDTFIVWAFAGLILPFILGWLIGGTVTDALTGLLWGGAVRMLVMHHATYSINSLCHFFGRQRFSTGDESRNLLWLSFFTFGEAWHNNHHAFPTSARHGLKAWQFDPSSWVIWGLEKCGLAWDVVRVSPERQAAKLAA